MKILREGTAVDAFFETLEEKRAGVLLLDYDGTLAPFREARDEAVPFPGVRESLDEIRKVHQAAEAAPPLVISGRRSEEVVRLLGLHPPIEVWGCHGWERLHPDGKLEQIDPGERARAGLTLAFREAAERLGEGGVEHKGAAVAAHFRGLDAKARERAAGELERRWGAVAEASGELELRPFDGGLEIRAGARDKGTAVREILEEMPSGTPIAYLGDDLTDEDAFTAVRARGGLSVLVRPELRATGADVWLLPPDELLTFLDRWSRALASPTG